MAMVMIETSGRVDKIESRKKKVVKLKLVTVKIRQCMTDKQNRAQLQKLSAYRRDELNLGRPFGCEWDFIHITNGRQNAAYVPAMGIIGADTTRCFLNGRAFPCIFERPKWPFSRVLPLSTCESALGILFKEEGAMPVTLCHYAKMFLFCHTWDGKQTRFGGITSEIEIKIWYTSHTDKIYTDLSWSVATSQCIFDHNIIEKKLFTSEVHLGGRWKCRLRFWEYK